MASTHSEDFCPFVEWQIACDQRGAATESVLQRFFTGRIHHHVTTSQSFAPA